MKKKSLTALALAAALAAVPVTAWGAGSAEYSDGGSGSSYGSSQDYATTVTVSTTGVKTTGATTSNNLGSSIGVAVETTTSAGQQVTVNSKGEAVIGDTAVGFAMGTAATAGLPNEIVTEIGKINSGASLDEITPTISLVQYNAQTGQTDVLEQSVGLSSYSALTGTHAIITKDASTAAVKTGDVEVSLYVPNLLDSLEGVSVLFYDNATGRWVLLQPLAVDPVSKTVTVNVSGSGTLSVVYKR